MLKLKHWSIRGRQFANTGARRVSLFVVAFFVMATSIFSFSAPTPAYAADALSTGQGLSSGFGSSVSTCAIETVGWVICPVMRTIAKLADYGFSFINENYLKIDYAIANTSSGAYTAWEVMRTIANIVFVLVFLVITYSQITGRNSGGYNIKRILPRLIIGAILVNISYYLCVIAIDLSNLLGGSILDIMKGVTDRIGTPALSLDNAANGFKDGVLTDLTSSVLTKSGTVWILLAPIAAVIVSIAVISAAGIVLLIARKVIVAMLVLVSPLLFVTYLLPNIEHYFQQWLRLFVQLLLVFPVVAFLLGTGQIISATIINVGSGGDTNYSVKDDSYQAKSGGSGSATTDLAAAAAAVLPLIGVWFMMKGLSSVMSTAGARITAGVNRGARSREREKQLQAKMNKPGLAQAGLANPVYDRKPAFSRLAGRRRKATPGGSAFGSESGSNRAAGSATNRPGQSLASTMENLMGGGQKGDQPTQAASDAAKKLEELNNAQINADMATAAGAQVAAVKEEEKKKGKTAKDIFNNMNRARPISKDQQRSFGTAGAQPTGPGGGGGGAGGAQPAANHTIDYRAPGMAQAMNAPAPSGGGGKPTIIVAPVQVDASALLNNKSPQAMAAEHGMTQPPVTGTQEKAKARAQKYIFDSASDVEEARKSLDLTNKKPDEAPHEQTDNQGGQ